MTTDPLIEELLTAILDLKIRDRRRRTLGMSEAEAKWLDELHAALVRWLECYDDILSDVKAETDRSSSTFTLASRRKPIVRFSTSAQSLLEILRKHREQQPFTYQAIRSLAVTSAYWWSHARLEYLLAELEFAKVLNRSQPTR